RPGSLRVTGLSLLLVPRGLLVLLLVGRLVGGLVVLRRGLLLLDEPELLPERLELGFGVGRRVTGARDGEDRLGFLRPPGPGERAREEDEVVRRDEREAALQR